MWWFFSKLNDGVNWTAEHYSAPFISSGAIAFLLIHIYSNKRQHERYLFPLIGVLAAAVFGALLVDPQEISFARLCSVLLLYAVATFILLSNLMTAGLAK